MRTVFFGTPDVARIGLDALLASAHEIVAVVTQPDKPKGRSGTPQPGPVKQRALESGIPVLQPDTPKADGFAGELRAYAPGVLAVLAYGHLLPVAVLEVAPAINAHLSLLPRYRGAAPVQRAILAGERSTGVTTFLLEPAMDAGPILMSQEVDIGPEETAGELLARLASIGAELLVRSIDALAEHSLHPRDQDPALATPAPKVRPDEARIDWSAPAEHIARVVRAFNPSPGAWTTLGGKRIKIFRVAVLASETGEPRTTAGSLDRVHTGDGVLQLIEVQPEGGRRMTGAEFARGHTANAVARWGTDDP